MPNFWLRVFEDFFIDIWETSHTFHLFTDAAGSVGFCAVFGCHWLQGICLEMWKTFITAFFPIVITVHVWGFIQVMSVSYFRRIMPLLWTPSISKHSNVIRVTLTS